MSISQCGYTSIITPAPLPGKSYLSGVPLCSLDFLVANIRASQFIGSGYFYFRTNIGLTLRSHSNYVRSSKTDRFNQGALRSLDGINSPLFPCLDMTPLISESRRPTEPIFQRNISNVTGLPLSRSASAHGLDPTRLSSHSLWPGWATALFIDGAPFGFIRRFGRWDSMRFHDYLWRDGVLFTPLSEKLISPICVTPHLKDENLLVPQTCQTPISPFLFERLFCYPPILPPFPFRR